MADLFRLYVRTKKFDAAEKLVNSTLQTDPNNVMSYIRRGFLHRIENRLSDAEAALKTAVEKDTENVNGLYALANFYYLLKRDEEAEKTIRLGLERQKNNGVMRLLLANILERGNRIDEAIEVYEAMFKAEPRSLIVANNLASLLSEKKGQPDNLKRAYEIAHSRFRTSKTPQFLDTLGWIHVLRGEFGEGVQLLKTALESLPQFGIVHYHLGMAYKGLGEDKLAVGSLKQADTLMQGQTFSGTEMLQKAIKELSEKSAATKSKS